MIVILHTMLEVYYI